MKTKNDKETPIIRVVLYDLRKEAKEKTKSMTFYKNGENPTLNEIAAIVRKSLSKGEHDGIYEEGL